MANCIHTTDKFNRIAPQAICSKPYGFDELNNCPHINDLLTACLFDMHFTACPIMSERQYQMQPNKDRHTSKISVTLFISRFRPLSVKSNLLKFSVNWRRNRWSAMHIRVPVFHTYQLMAWSVFKSIYRRSSMDYIRESIPVKQSQPNWIRRLILIQRLWADFVAYLYTNNSKNNEYTINKLVRMEIELQMCVSIHRILSIHFKKRKNRFPDLIFRVDFLLPLFASRSTVLLPDNDF